MPPHIARDNATRARVGSRVEHVFAAEKRRMGLVVRTIGLARATAKITLANLVTTSPGSPGSRPDPCRPDPKFSPSLSSSEVSLFDRRDRFSAPT